jgi:hypothetical protein
LSFLHLREMMRKPSSVPEGSREDVWVQQASWRAPKSRPAKTSPLAPELDFFHSPIAIQAAEDLGPNTYPLADLEFVVRLLSDVRNHTNDFVTGDNMLG